MKSILENRKGLEECVLQVAEVAGYLWEKGWAERNGGNITVNVTEYVDDEIRKMPAISDVIQIGTTLPNIKGCYFYCKGTGKRMRDLARKPMANGSIIRILDDCASYVIIADEAVMPTSELPSHLSMHDYLIGSGSKYKASLHTHPIELVAMSHNPAMLEKDVMGKILWSMIPETLAFAPLGLKRGEEQRLTETAGTGKEIVIPLMHKFIHQGSLVHVGVAVSTYLLKTLYSDRVFHALLPLFYCKDTPFA